MTPVVTARSAGLSRNDTIPGASMDPIATAHAVVEAFLSFAQQAKHSDVPVLRAMLAVQRVR